VFVARSVQHSFLLLPFLSPFKWLSILTNCFSDNSQWAQILLLLFTNVFMKAQAILAIMAIFYSLRCIFLVYWWLQQSNFENASLTPPSSEKLNPKLPFYYIVSLRGRNNLAFYCPVKGKSIFYLLFYSHCNIQLIHNNGTL